MSEEKTILDKLKDIENKLEAKTGVDLPTPVYIFLALILVAEVAKFIL